MCVSVFQIVSVSLYVILCASRGQAGSLRREVTGSEEARDGAREL